MKKKLTSVLSSKSSPPPPPPAAAPAAAPKVSAAIRGSQLSRHVSSKVFNRPEVREGSPNQPS